MTPPENAARPACAHDQTGAHTVIIPGPQGQTGWIECPGPALRLLELCACEGGATRGLQRAGWHVTAVDIDGAALDRNPADVTVKADAEYEVDD